MIEMVNTPDPYPILPCVSSVYGRSEINLMAPKMQHYEQTYQSGDMGFHECHADCRCDGRVDRVSSEVEDLIADQRAGRVTAHDLVSVLSLRCAFYNKKH